MAKHILIIKAVLVGAALAVAASCSLTGHHPEAHPRKVGKRVERLHREVVSALGRAPTSDSGAFARLCVEDWEKGKSVKPEPGDPWKVTYNQFEFYVDIRLAVKAQNDIPLIYGALVRNLKNAGGWKVEEQKNMAGYPGAVSGEKDDVQLSAHDTPDGRGGHIVYVSLQSDCYRHPNA
ncbi:hypothetical protein [Actinomadura opuntiae]|uniref:hypothetical protein n=1 Tax=Actinomadura sp. OS1-43 TaxID=604315 RepID=UPI00255AFE22|nr:hypothetical protein [Actinomadura sp. OS1-43]MDL4814768.1 hypothetical protein [Actinomadura sp. OS1-43]